MVGVESALFKDSMLQGLRGRFVISNRAPTRESRAQTPPWCIQGSTDALGTVMSQIPWNIYEIHALGGFTFSGLDPRDKHDKTVMRAFKVTGLVLLCIVHTA